MKNINEELTNLKYLMKYDRSLTLNENVESLSGNVPEDALKKIDEYQSSLCKTNANSCVACGDMMRQLPTGKLNEKQIEKCLECNKKTGKDYNDCSKMKGMILNASIEYQKEMQGVDSVERGANKITMASSLLATLTTIYTQIKDMFRKEPQQ
jgi:hypothetical protein